LLPLTILPIGLKLNYLPKSPLSK